MNITVTLTVKIYIILAREIISKNYTIYNHILALHFDTAYIMKSKSSILVVTTKIIHTPYLHNLFVFIVFESEYNTLVQYTYPDVFAVKKTVSHSL